MDINFNSPPFSGIENLTNEEMESIWANLNKENSKFPKGISVIKLEKTDIGTKIFITKNNKIEKVEILDKEFYIYINNLLPIKIFSLEQVNSIISLIKKNDKYNIKINLYKPDENQQNPFTNFNSIEIKSKEQEEIKNFETFIKRGKYSFCQNEQIEEKIILVEKPKLSQYFDEILNYPYVHRYFKLIINNNRLKLIKKIDDFWLSDKIFYVIMGTDGIGKTTTILYFISFIHKYKILYLNLKLFLGKNKQLVEKIFFNELQRVFFIDKNNYPPSMMQFEYKSFQKLKSTILNNLKTENNLSGIEFMWKLLQEFIKTFRICGVFGSNVLFILDQYKNDIIDDEKYNQINEICYLIDENNNDYSVFYKIKLLIIISINNFDTKKMFLENINITYFNSNINNNINFIEKKNKDEKDNQMNYELLKIGEYLDKKYEKINQIFNDKLSHLEYNTRISSSYCFLNTTYFKKTKKEYLNYNSNCKRLIPDTFGNNFKRCIRAFDYSLKYFDLLMKEIDNNKKSDEENDIEYEKRISKLFYIKMYDKIKNNVKKCYDYMQKERPDKLPPNLMVENLIFLRNCIYEEKTFLSIEIEYLLKSFPVKYLNIFLACSDEIAKNETEINDFNFYFTYSNLFIKHAFNKIIKEYSIDRIYNDFDGNYFEKMVNDNLLKFKFHNKDLIKRNIFSLVGITKSTIDYVKKLRDKENSEFFNFYELKRYNIDIDDIDKEKLKNSKLDFINNDLFLNQISKNGRSFDAALLIKKNKSDDKGTHDMIIFQDTINKIAKCKVKEIYINDSINSKNYLEFVYQGLKIDKIYFIFIIPDNYPNIEETKKKLDLFNIYYIYFSLSKKIFLDTQNNIISDFRINQANIDFSNKNFPLIKSISDINLSKYIIKESTKKYLIKRKINNNKSFIDIYNKISQINFHDCLKIVIPNKLKENIIKAFIEEKYFKKDDIINFIHSANYKGLEIENLFNNTNNMIIFSYNEYIYLYYYSYFQINEQFDIKKMENLNIQNIIDIKSPKKDLNELNEIKKYPLFCFCFNVIKNYDF